MSFNIEDISTNASTVIPVTPFPTVYPPTATTITPDVEPVKCNQYVVKNKTHILYGGYEGIPENLLINFTGWIVSHLNVFYSLLIGLYSSIKICLAFHMNYRL